MTHGRSMSIGHEAAIHRADPVIDSGFLLFSQRFPRMSSKAALNNRQHRIEEHYSVNKISTPSRWLSTGSSQCASLSSSSPSSYLASQPTVSFPLPQACRFSLMTDVIVCIVANDYNGGYYARGNASPSQVNFMIFCAVWSILAVAFLILS